MVSYPSSANGGLPAGDGVRPGLDALHPFVHESLHELVLVRLIAVRREFGLGRPVLEEPESPWRFHVLGPPVFDASGIATAALSHGREPCSDILALGDRVLQVSTGHDHVLLLDGHISKTTSVSG